MTDEEVFNTAPNLGGRIPTPDPRTVTPDPGLSIENAPLGQLEQGGFAKLLDFMSGQQSSPENLMQAPLPETDRSQAVGRGLLRGVYTPAIEPYIAAMEAMLGGKIPGREDMSPGDMFEVSLDKAKRIKERDRARYPGTTIGSEVAGTLPLSLGVSSIPKVATAIRTSPIKAGAALGGGFGALYGGTGAESLEGVPMEALKGGGIGTLTGAGVAFGMDRFIAPGTRAILDSFKTSRAKSHELISKFMRDIFPDTKTALAAAKDVASPETALVDVSRGTRQIGQTISATSPRFGQRAEQFLTDRARGAIERVNNVTNKILGTRGKNVSGTLKGLQQKRFEQFNEIINDVYAQPVDATKTQAFVAQVDDAIERTHGVKGFSTALKQLRRSLFKDPKMEVLKDDYETLHLARKAYGDVVNKAGSGAKTLLREVRDGFDDIFPPEYKTANSIWSSSKKTEEAMQLGRKVLREDVDILTDDLANMPQAEKEGFLIGVARAIDDVVKTPQEGGKVTGVFNKPIVAERLRAVMPDETTFNEFMSRVGKENTFNLTKNAILSGSATQERQAADRLFNQKAAQFGEGDLKSGAIRRGMDWLFGIKNDKTANVSDDVIDALADDLLTTGKVTPTFISKLMSTPLKDRATDFINTAMTPVVIGAAAQTGQMTLGETPPE